MSLDRKRWLLLAQELKFNQLDIARKQADTWRAGLATLTTLLTGVLIVKGKQDAGTLPTVYQIAVAVLLAAALALLLAATMWLSRALAGPPGEQILLTGEGLEEWTASEVRKVTKALSWVPGMAGTSVILVAAAVGVTWFAPTARQQSDRPLVKVTVTGGQSCGALVGETRQEVILTAPSGSTPTAIPMPSVLVMTPVTNCSLATAVVASEAKAKIKSLSVAVWSIDPDFSVHYRLVSGTLGGARERSRRPSRGSMLVLGGCGVQVLIRWNRINRG